MRWPGRTREIRGGDREAVAGRRHQRHAVGLGADDPPEQRAQPFDVGEPVRGASIVHGLRAPLERRLPGRANRVQLRREVRRVEVGDLRWDVERRPLIAEDVGRGELHLPTVWAPLGARNVDARWLPYDGAMELRQLRAFVQVAQAGTFTRGAEELHLAQSAVSHAIGQLEAELGFTLLRRTSRGVVLTEAGTVVLERAREILAGADAIRADLAALTGLQEGTVVLGTMLPPGPWICRDCWLASTTRTPASGCGCGKAARPRSSRCCVATRSTSPSPGCRPTPSPTGSPGSRC